MSNDFDRILEMIHLFRPSLPSKQKLTDECNHHDQNMSRLLPFSLFHRRVFSIDAEEFLIFMIFSIFRPPASFAFLQSSLTQSLSLFFFVSFSTEMQVGGPGELIEWKFLRSCCLASIWKFALRPFVMILYQ